MMATYEYVELLMVSKTTAHSGNPGEKANLSIEESQRVEKGVIFLHEAAAEMSRYPVMNDFNSISKCCRIMQIHA